jgi:hypothetical protein
MTYTLAYNNYNTICENCLGTWSGNRMHQSYTLLGYDGKPWLRKGQLVHYNDYAVDYPHGIFSTDRLDKSPHANTKLLGSIAYQQRTDRFVGQLTFFGNFRLDSIELRDVVSYSQPTRSTLPFKLHNQSSIIPIALMAKNLTGIGPSSTIQSQWQVTTFAQGGNIAAVPNIFTGKGGANVCHRYHDGVLTKQPLWPWPMNQRIKDAMAESGRIVVDVTSTVEEIFGTIPSSCKRSEGNTVSK